MRSPLALIKSIVALKEVTSLEVHFSPKGIQFKCMNFVRKGDEVIPNGELITDSNLANMDSLQSGKTDLSITITGKGVLRKIISSEKAGIALIKEAFPQISVDDFYYQADQIPQGYLVSIVRKSQLSEILNPESSLIQRMVSLNLGVGSFIKLFEKNVQLSCYNIRLENRELVQITESKEEPSQQVTVGSESLPAESALLQLAGYYSLMGIGPSLSSEVETTLKNTSTSIENNLLKKGGVAAIVLTLLMVLVNFVCFSSLNKTLNQESIKKLSVEKEMRELQEKQNQFKERKELFDKLNFKEQTHHSELIDQIASRATSDIQFTSVVVYPEKNSNQAKKSIEFDKNSMQITGLAKHSDGFKKFTQYLNELDLLKSVKMTQFSRNQKLGGYDFKLLIALNE
ncbi:MAG: hypothetical protein CL840_14780 [Crocinitomicaceae bacterium]|nr:hypothetical protein [Crocinitomicaceae bacterium]|tara:strand:- start:39307 stop:40506 length:1200 start_codon:yes stop_codon:yes gene_type:complete